MIATLVLVLAASPEPLAYGYRSGGEGKPNTWDVSDWSKAKSVWVATDGAHLREKPDADAAVVAELDFGVPVQRVEAVTPEPIEVKDRTDRWYRVSVQGHDGFLFGSVLTTARYEDDFDGDGDLELATVAFTAEKKIRVRFFEPKLKKETSVDVAPTGGAYISFIGGYAWPELVKKATAGLPLVHVDTHVEACSDFSDYWVSYRDGTPRVALWLAGLRDPPNMATYRVEFKPAKSTVLVHHQQDVEEGKPPKKWTETWVLDGGVYVEAKPHKQ